ncbi:hypothetical protein AR687_01895 [Flavobacteriaceae bacterium CRH]|nr:hypothetical protein AR687_01895 [Flavobacteriaceae bacterium CRH]
MKVEKQKKRIAILGGGPSGLFVYKRLIESGETDFEIDIFEKKTQLGAGMPYSLDGANDEHVTNVSDNEVPPIVTPMSEWIYTAPAYLLERFKINPAEFNEYKVVPRLLFGQYLSDQFDLLKESANTLGITTNVHFQNEVIDIRQNEQNNEVYIETTALGILPFDYTIICTGHKWPKEHEGKVAGYYDAPYPPSKLILPLNHAVAVRGSSLTAIDAIRTLARSNGTFEKDENNNNLVYKISNESPEFKIMMHSRNGLLPAVRFHLEDSHLNNASLLTPEEIDLHKKNNGGFLSLDYVFQKNFKDIFISKDPEFYQRIKDLSIEEFVAEMMELRERIEPFTLLKAEYIQAEKSMKRHESVYWKEMLAVLSFAMNQPAKYLSAEDMQRLQKVLMPLITIVIAFVPQTSCLELLALHQAGILDIVSVGSDSTVEPQEEGGIIYHFEDEENNNHSVYYKTFVDCIGQPHLSYEKFPFRGLVAQKIISPAKIKFQSQVSGKEALENGNKLVEQDANDNYFLNVSGIAINDNFQIIDQYGAYNENIFVMAVPYIGGFNPDYSGLDFCEAASLRILNSIMEN